MNPPRPLLALLATALILSGFAVLSAPTYVFRAEPSDMTISGTSTLHDWTCDVPDIDGRLQASPADSGIMLADLTKTQVSIAVDAIECHKDRMNRNLREAMSSNKYPNILFLLEKADIAPLPDSAGAWMNVDATGELMISGTRKQITLPVKAQRLDDGGLRFVGSTTFNMSEYGVDPPTVMLGAIKTGDEITINFDVVATPPAS
jgi:polyisoprenoid-binding protein YceI